MTRLLRLGAFVVATTFLTNIALIEVVNAGEEQRAPPPTRSSDTLSDRVFRVISRIQEMLAPEDPDEAPDYVTAKEELDELYEDRYERMNDFEKSTVLNFYTNIYLSTDNIPEAMRIFEQILTIEDLREDTRLRSLRALGQLKLAEEQFEDSISYYNQWRELSLEEDDSVFLGLANSHYSIEQYAEAVPMLLNHMEMLVDQGETLGRNKWSLLNVLYIEQEDYVNALEVTKNMVVNFNEATDWTNLSAIYSFLEEDENRIGTLFIRYLAGIMDSDAEYLNLAQSLAGEEAPYAGAMVLEAGFEAGIVEEDLDNLFILIQMYQLANEFDLAVEPAIKLAELDPTGDGYDTLGYIYYILHDYAASAEAFQASVDKGSLDDAAATNLFLSRALVEVDRYDEAATAARRSSDLGDEDDREAAANYLRFIEGQQARYDAIQARKAEVLDFYVSYD